MQVIKAQKSAIKTQYCKCEFVRIWFCSVMDLARQPYEPFLKSVIGVAVNLP